MLWISRHTPGYTVASSAQQHSLVLLDVGRQHQGTYTCIASNAAGQAPAPQACTSLAVSGRGAWAEAACSLQAPDPVPTHYPVGSAQLEPPRSPHHPGVVSSRALSATRRAGESSAHPFHFLPLVG